MKAILISALSVLFYFQCLGNVIEVRGVFSNGDEFAYSLEYNPNSVDSELDDPTEGDYYTWTGIITLDWAGNHIQTSGSSVYVFDDHNGLSGISFYNEHGFEWNGLSFGPMALYYSGLSPFAPFKALFPSDSLSLVAELSGHPVWESGLVSPYYEVNDLSGAFHLETDQPIPIYTVSEVPEPETLALILVLGMAVSLHRIR